MSLESDVADLQAAVAALQTSDGLQDQYLFILAGDVQALKNRCTSLESRTLALEGDVATLQSQVAVLQDQVFTLQIQVADHENRISVLELTKGKHLSSYKKLLAVLLSRSALDIRDYQEVYDPLATPGELPDLPSNPQDLTGQVVDETTRSVAPGQANAKGNSP